MAMTCRVCVHGDRERIDAELLRGVPTRTIGDQYGPSHQSLLRHRQHVAEHVALAHDAREIAGADTLLAKVADLERQARRLLDKSERQGKLGVSVAALRELRGIVELLARVTGELETGVVVNVLASPEWSGVQRRLLVALEPFPDAKVAAARALLTDGHTDA
jgi:hypothetical protein